MGKDVIVSNSIIIPERELHWSFVRSSGPGGQNVNKVNTKAVLRWPVGDSTALPEGVKQRFLTKYKNRIAQNGDLLLTSQRYRDQPKNIADCEEKLRKLIEAVEKPPVPRRKKRIPRSVIERRLSNKRQKAQKKHNRKFSPGRDQD